MRQRKQKKFNQLKFNPIQPKQPQQFKATEKENAPTESIDSKTQRERSYAAAVKKSNSKTNLSLRRTLSKTSTQDKTQRSIVQQLDIQNNEKTFRNRNTLTTAKETTSERDDIKYKEMQEQIKILTSEVTKLKHRIRIKNNKTLPKTIRKLKLKQFHHHHLHLHQESTTYCQETTPFFIHKIQKTCRTPLQRTEA